MQRTKLYSLILVLFTLADLAATDVLAQTVLQRKRLGNETEDITFITTGPWANYVAILDGDQVGGIHRGGRPRGLFDLLELGIRISPRGIAYMPSEALFAVNDGTEVNMLFLVDSHGQAEGTRIIQYLNGFIPSLEM